MGTQGVPAKYGGFETLVENIIGENCSKEVEYTVFCSGKADEHLLSIFQRLYEEEGEAFGTRASQHQYELVKKAIPQVSYDPVSRIRRLKVSGAGKRDRIPKCWSWF